MQNSPYLLTENAQKRNEAKIQTENNNKELERNNNEKTAVQSFKDFSENLVKKTKNFFAFESRNNARNKCKCDENLRDNSGTCMRAMKWILYHYKTTDLPNLKSIYENLLTVPGDEACANQIEKDLPRSFPYYPYFAVDGEGYQSLRRVLVTFSKYDPNIGGFFDILQKFIF